MTSLEIVDMINVEREAIEILTGKPQKVLSHKNFLAKTKDVLGEKDAAKFSAASSYQGNGSAVLTREIYIFPKREATLMAMSYSPKISAAVYDAMTALEARVEELEKPAALTLPNFSNPAEAARAWALQYEESLRLSTEVAQQAVIVTQQAVVIEEAKPAVEFMEQYVEADEDYGIQAVARGQENTRRGSISKIFCSRGNAIGTKSNFARSSLREVGRIFCIPMSYSQ